jgi:hypothetical protein
MDDVPMPDPDLWHRIRVGFMLEPWSRRWCRARAWYASRPEYIRRFVDRGSRYLHHIVGEVEKRGMPMEIALLPVVESAFNPKAYSRSKAAGLWQFIRRPARATACRRIGGRTTARRDRRHRRGAQLLERPAPDVRQLGAGARRLQLRRGLRGARHRGQPEAGPRDRLLEPHLPVETRNYVPKLFAVKNIVLAPPTTASSWRASRHGLLLEVQAPAKIDVKVAAKLAGMSEDEFVALNPAHNKPVAAGTGMFILRWTAPTRSRRTRGLRQAAGELDHLPGEALRIDRRHRQAPQHHHRAAEGAKRRAQARQEGAPQGGHRDHGADAGRLFAAAGQGCPARHDSARARFGRLHEARRQSEPRFDDRIYTVRAGDTFYGIAKRYGIGWMPSSA